MMIWEGSEGNEVFVSSMCCIWLMEDFRGSVVEVTDNVFLIFQVIFFDLD